MMQNLLREAAAESRKRLLESITTSRNRLKLASLVEDGKAELRKRALKIAIATLSSQKGRPLIAATAIAAGAAYLLRKPISGAVAKQLSKEKEHVQLDQG